MNVGTISGVSSVDVFLPEDSSNASSINLEPDSLNNAQTKADVCAQYDSDAGEVSKSLFSSCGQDGVGLFGTANANSMVHGLQTNHHPFGNHQINHSAQANTLQASQVKPAMIAQSTAKKPSPASSAPTSLPDLEAELERENPQAGTGTKFLEGATKTFSYTSIPTPMGGIAADVLRAQTNISYSDRNLQIMKGNIFNQAQINYQNEQGIGITKQINDTQLELMGNIIDFLDENKEQNTKFVENRVYEGGNLDVQLIKDNADVSNHGLYESAVNTQKSMFETYAKETQHAIDEAGTQQDQKINLSYARSLEAGDFASAQLLSLFDKLCETGSNTTVPLQTRQAASAAISFVRQEKLANTPDYKVMQGLAQHFGPLLEAIDGDFAPSVSSEGFSIDPAKAHETYRADIPKMQDITRPEVVQYPVPPPPELPVFEAFETLPNGQALALLRNPNPLVSVTPVGQNAVPASSNDTGQLPAVRSIEGVNQDIYQTGSTAYSVATSDGAARLSFPLYNAAVSLYPGIDPARMSFTKVLRDQSFELLEIAGKTSLGNEKLLSGAIKSSELIQQRQQQEIENAQAVIKTTTSVATSAVARENNGTEMITRAIVSVRANTANASEKIANVSADYRKAVSTEQGKQQQAISDAKLELVERINHISRTTDTALADLERANQNAPQLLREFVARVGDFVDSVPQADGGTSFVPKPNLTPAEMRAVIAVHAISEVQNVPPAFLLDQVQNYVGQQDFVDIMGERYGSIDSLLGLPE